MVVYIYIFGVSGVAITLAYLAFIVYIINHFFIILKNLFSLLVFYFIISVANIYIYIWIHIN